MNGNLNTGNDGYYGLWLSNTDPSNNAGNATRRVVSRAVSFSVWYVIRITVNERGAGTVVVEDLQGSRLATEIISPWELAPFLLCSPNGRGCHTHVGQTRRLEVSKNLRRLA